MAFLISLKIYAPFLSYVLYLLYYSIVKVTFKKYKY